MWSPFAPGPATADELSAEPSPAGTELRILDPIIGYPERGGCYLKGIVRP